MNELFTLYTPEEINELLKVFTSITMLTFATSLGTFSRELIFPKTNTLSENIGLAFVSGFIAFGLTLRYGDILTVEKSFVLCTFLGFFLPVFKNWFKGKKIFKILFSVLNKTSDIASTAIDEINKELEKEEDKDKE